MTWECSNHLIVNSNAVRWRWCGVKSGLLGSTYSESLWHDKWGLGISSPDFHAWALVPGFLVSSLASASSGGCRIAQFLFGFQLQTWGRSHRTQYSSMWFLIHMPERDDAGDESMGEGMDNLIGPLWELTEILNGLLKTTVTLSALLVCEKGFFWYSYN